MSLLRGSVLALLALLLAGCLKKPPPMPYMTVAGHDGECGYDYNGAAIEIGSVVETARGWDRGFEAALLFRFEPVPQACVDRARIALKRAGFTNVWIIVTTTPRPNDPPIMP